MNKTIGILALVLGIGIMTFTNPNQQQYVQYASEQIIRELPQDFCNNSQLKKWFDFANQNLSQLCQSGLGLGLNLGKESVKQIIDNNTQRQNLILLSLYTTNIANRQYQTAGLFGKFITFKKTE
ncbi:hypothetical protein Sta7437_3965 [Stanieria cyanosphaera PCC 7437]|uniref:DUF4359 domain-containing protein n=1 Tax=Stanieria cyanosphaera (strain ATCC 29371 / PCC 7437) TaxID=111780 RepID=K9Y0I2_STAC7|nr:DUF4359 domain-containing protein [Stanieria cyanosphaera]AFZ37447.1 hypothetical protein Sta7437_3965 [Stanieria cyanosphaera PCC 7437]